MVLQAHINFSGMEKDFWQCRRGDYFGIARSEFRVHEPN